MSMLRQLINYHPETVLGPKDILNCLAGPQKLLPSKLFYDERGSQLFDRICNLPEYYLTRTEQAIMTEFVAEMCARIGPRALLVELGSGSSVKTRALLDNLENPAAYIPVDISAAHLAASAAVIAAGYPALEVIPVSADYEQAFTLPEPEMRPQKKVVYFPGSTIGNFHPPDVISFMQHIRAICGGRCDILLGVDLKKDAGILHRAYNDCDGITAEFNLNILRHLNAVYGADFNLDSFGHVAFYNADAGRIEMHLKSLARQSVRIMGQEVRFDAGENIWTESSYKYSLDDFNLLAEQADFRTSQVWTDYHRMFSVQYLETR